MPVSFITQYAYASRVLFPPRPLHSQLFPNILYKPCCSRLIFGLNSTKSKMDALATEAAAAKVYQDFVPPPELVEEPECDTLVVYLPGFKKEQLRIQLHKRNLVISGERPVGDNTWRRFQKTLPISSNYDISKITTKFEDSRLYITQPKLIPSAHKQDQKKPTTSHEDQKAEKQDQEKETSTKTPEPHKIVDKNEDPNKVRQKEATTTAKVYQDFVPPTELVEEPDRDTLLIYLPGFKKEHLRVQLSKSRNLVISGEHHVGDNTWRRFQKTIPISSSCDISKITAKFEDLILYITQPKLIASSQKQDQKKQISSHEDQKAEKQDQEKATSNKTPEPHKLVDKNEDPNKVKRVLDHKQPDNTNVERKAAAQENAEMLTENENISKSAEYSSYAKSVPDKISKKKNENIAETGQMEGNSDLKHKTDYGNFFTKFSMRKKVINIILALLMAIPAIVFVLHVKYSVGNWKKAEKENV